MEEKEVVNTEVENEEELFKDEVVEEEKASTPVIEEEPKPKVQSSKVNHEEKLKRLQQEAFTKGRIQELGGINPFTKEPIKNERDLQLYDEMKEAKDKGEEDAVKSTYKRKYDEIISREEEQTRKQETMKKQLESFRKVVPSLDLRKKILDNEDFRTLYEQTLENGGDLGQVAKTFLKLTRMGEEYEEVKKKIPPVPSPNASEQKAPVDYKNMSYEEAEEAFKKLVGRK